MIWALVLKGGFEEEGERSMEGTRALFTGRKEAGPRKGSQTKTRAGSVLHPEVLSPRNTWS